MSYRTAGFGWLPDPPDHRDLTAPSVLRLATGQTTLPTAVDLRHHDTAIFSQGKLGSCTAHAVSGLAQYIELAQYQQSVPASRLFLYKVTRQFLQLTGDTGAYLRSTMKALRLFGVCPEQYWPYDEAEFDVEPTAFCFAMAADYRSITYSRLDGLDQLRGCLAQGHPFVFGFSCFTEIGSEAVTKAGKIPMPTPNERRAGGHAVMAVGYDDTAGNLIIRNSWGPDWGDQGYGYLPYGYVTSGLAADFWTLTKTNFEGLAGAR